jgi:hypothetical protein
MLVLAGSALAAFLLAGAGASTTVPELRGLPVGGVDARAQRTHVHPAFSTRFANAAAGIAVAQTPAPGRRVSYGATVRVVLSAGPPPVRVPELVGLSAASAESQLEAAGLRYAVTLVSAPGSTANAVVQQSPLAARSVPRGSKVALNVAEPPRWRALTSFSGTGGGHSVPVSIRGQHWRVLYDMSYPGTCLLLVTCLGPSAEAKDVNTGAGFGGFELSEGSSKTHTFDSGPGLYSVQVSGGTDAAEWSMTVEDYY